MTTTQTQATPDPAVVDALVGKAVTELAGTFHAVTALVGDRLGLYRHLAETGPTTAAALAAAAGIGERICAEWLAAQATAGWCEADEASGTFWLSPEQALVLADPAFPAFLPAGLQLALSTAHDADRLVDAYRRGGAFGWGEHHHDLFEGTARFFQPGYDAFLVEQWIPALDGVEARLHAGARVADLGCGWGSSTLALAEAFPASTFVGSDAHGPSVEAANRAARERGVADRCRFVTATAADHPAVELGYDLVCTFDALHDMGDPSAAAARVRSILAPGGSWLVVEPRAGATLAERTQPVGALFSAASSLICVPSALAQDGPEALGAQCGEAGLRRVVAAGGLTDVRCVAETPTNAVYQVRP